MTAVGIEELSDELRDRLRRQLLAWRRDLFAMDRRQRLLYFKHTKSGSLEISGPGLATVFDLVTGVHGRCGVAVDDAGGRQAGRLLVSDKSEGELANSLRRLDQVSQQVFTDRGFWTLYVGLGMLEWVDPQDQKPVSSPLVLVPVQLTRGGAHQPYSVSRTEEDIVLNPVLARKLEDDFAIRLDAVDVDALDIAKVLHAVGTAVESQPEWRVAERAVLTTFTFHKEAIYRDLVEHEGVVAAHPLVQLLALGPDAPVAGSFDFSPVPDEDLDRVAPPENMLSILDADSSQRRCIVAAKDGRSFVMDGPPGTGKSQTIANIIVELIAAGRTVLFVSEKAAALDVVRKRLADARLDQFLLELHSHNATRKHVVEAFDRALSQRPAAQGQFDGADGVRLAKARANLSGYAAAVNEPRPALGRTFHQVLGRLAQLNDLAAWTVTADLSWGELDAARLVDLRQWGERLGRAWRPVLEGEDFLWRDLASLDRGSTAVRRLAGVVSAAADGAEALVNRARAVDGDLGLMWAYSRPDLGRRVELLTALENPPRHPASWLTRGELGQVRERTEELATATAAYRSAASEVGRRAGAGWLRLDPEFLPPLRDAVRGTPESWTPDSALTHEKFRAAHQFLQETPQRLLAVADDARMLASLFGMPVEKLTTARATELAGLAKLGGSATPPEPSWLTPGLQAALDESYRVLDELVDVVRQREAAIGSVFTRAALDLDLAVLNTRFTEVHRGLRRLSSAARADRKALKAATVAGRVDKNVLARLEEAVAWQRVEQQLAVKEQDHAAPLGTYYRGRDTDFSRVAAAIENARQAVRLAGADLNSSALARQLARGGEPDPALVIAAERLERNVEDWRQDARTHLGDGAWTEWLDRKPLDRAATWCATAADRLAAAVEAAAHVAEVTTRSVTLGECVDLLSRAAAAADASAQIYNRYEQDTDLLGPVYEGVGTDWRELREALGWAERVRKIVGGPVAPVVAEKFAVPTIATAEVEQLVSGWDRLRDGVGSCFLDSRAGDLGADLDTDLGAAVELLREMANTAPADVEEWCEYIEASTHLADEFLGDVVDGIRAVRLGSDRVADAVERAVLEAWAEAVARSDKRLHQYRPRDRDAVVAEFRELDQRLVAEAHAEVVNRCAARRPQSLTGPAQLIRREAEKKTRHLPVRTLLDKAGMLAQELKPCFMMSPLSVSQYLPGGLHFDVVIFDEASQVLPSDAINCIYRGSQLIVAGDQKQLPPTAFFAKTAADEDVDGEDADLDSFDSVLDLCKGAGALKSLPLNWHYRSKHEALITYSNYRFYEGSLHTFPGAVFESDRLGVKSFVVAGVYRRGGARDNPVEAKTVVDRIIFHRQAHPDMSIGVVTFSSAQEDRILQEIEGRSASEPALRGILEEHDRLDGFFVKNLENVQGDERDLIIFSIGYGPDENGKFTMAFGPLNRDGGWRRLNVAITRARQRVEVVTSVTPGRFTETSSEGVRHLKNYLDFAARGMPALALDLEDSLGDAESPFEEDVLRVIRSWGYDAVPQVGAAGYRIDIGVRHPDLPGEYLLAVECDGAAYHSAKTARDRDRLREAVLRGLGWKVHRIWGLSWSRDRATQEQRLREAIEESLTSHGSSAPAPVSPRRASTVEFEEVDFDAPPGWAVAYHRATGLTASTYDLHTVEARPALRMYLEKLLAVEAPVHEDLVYRAVREDWGVGRIGQRMRAAIQDVLKVVRVRGAKVQRDVHGFFRVLDGQAVRVRVPADADTVRTVAQVPPEEFDLAVQSVVADAVVADHVAVTSAVARVFGWRRQGADIQTGVTASVSRLLGAGRLRSTAEGLLRRAD